MRGRPTAPGLAQRLSPRPPWGQWKLQTIADFSGGLNLRVANAELQDNELSDLWNFSLSDIGKLVKRSGLSTVTSALPGPARAMLVWTPQGGTKALYCVSTNTSGQGVLSEVNVATGAVTQIGVGLAPTGRPAMVAMAGKLCIFDGAGSWFYDGTTFGPLGVAAPAAAVTVAIDAVTGNLNGSYNYYQTFVRANGMESNPSPVSATVTPANQQVSLSALGVSSDATVTETRLYRIGGLNAGAAFMVVQLANGTTTYTDNASDASIQGNEVMQFTNSVPPSGLNVAAVFLGRIWATGNPAAPSRMYWSEVLQPWAWGDGFSFVDVGSDEPGGVTGIWPIAQQLLLFKPQSVWALNGQPPSNYFISQSVVPVGSIAPFSLQMTPAGVTYLAQDGVYWTNGYTGDLLPDDTDAGRRNKLEPLIVGIDLTKPVEGVYFDRTYYLFCTADGGTRMVMVFDFRHGAWTLYDWQCNTATVDLEAGVVYVAMQANGTVAIANSGTSDLGQPISPYATTKQFALQSPGWQKAFRWGWLEGGNTSAQPSLSVFVDDQATQFQVTCILTDTGQLIWNQGNWNEANWAGSDVVRFGFGIPATLAGRRIGFTINESSVYPLEIQEIDYQWMPQKVVF